MKKLLLSLTLLILTCGCTNIYKSDFNEIINQTISSKIASTNQNRKGYKYYLPRGIMAVTTKDYNEILRSKDDIYYLYVDIVSYYNKTTKEYQEKSDVYYSKRIEYNGLFGYLEIKEIDNEKYFIEIMYNYAKIEVIVKENNIHPAVSYAISILASIDYNNDIINNLLGEDIFQFSEIELNIFETTNPESNYLKYVEEYDQYNKKEELPDTDLIK